jgi:hypothetical protein
MSDPEQQAPSPEAPPLSEKTKAEMALGAQIVADKAEELARKAAAAAAEASPEAPPNEEVTLASNPKLKKKKD